MVFGIGRGGSKSSTTAEVLNDIAISATQKMVARCVTSATQQQLIQVQNVAGNVKISGVSMKQGASVNMKCMLSAEMQNSIQNEIATQITQFAASQSQALIGALGGSTSTATTAIKNRLALAVNQSTLQEAITQSMQQQEITAANIGGSLIISDVNMDQSLEMTSEALITGTAYSTVINDIANFVDQKAESKQEDPVGGWIDSFTGMIGSVVSSWLFMIFGGVAVVGIVVIFIFKYLNQSGALGEIGSAAAQKLRETQIGGPGGMGGMPGTRPGMPMMPGMPGMRPGMPMMPGMPGMPSPMPMMPGMPSPMMRT